MAETGELDFEGLARLKEIVVSVARDELRPRFARVSGERKTDGSLITVADLLVQQRISVELEAGWPGTLFLGEEMTESEQRALLGLDRPLWCLDPLDGTGNFAAGIPFFAVSLALLVRGEVKAGIVYDPMRDECFSALQGRGAFLNGKPLAAAPGGPALGQATGLVDFKRLPRDLAVRLASDAPYGSQRSFGSVALDWCWIAAGRCHVYLHGRQNLWDYAAGHLVLQEAGGRSVTLSGEPVLEATLRARSAVAALDPVLFREWTRWLGIDTFGLRRPGRDPSTKEGR